MGYKNTARALNKAKDLIAKNKELEERITNLIATLENQKVIYMNVVKAMVLQCGKPDGDQYILNIPEDVSGMENWTLETIPDEETHGLIMHLREREDKG